MIKRIKSYFSEKFVKSEFRDVVSGKQVCRYVDCYGGEYLKDSKRTFFRCKVEFK